MNLDKVNLDKINLDTLLDLTGLTRKDVRDALGLSPRFRDYALPALGLFSGGLILGAGVALLFAPKAGEKLRADISDEVRSRLDDIEQRLRGTAANDVSDEASDDSDDIQAQAA